MDKDAKEPSADMAEDTSKEPAKEAPAADGYDKKNWGKWVAIYVVAAIIIYGLIYYFITARNSSSPTAGSTAKSIY